MGPLDKLTSDKIRFDLINCLQTRQVNHCATKLDECADNISLVGDVKAHTHKSNFFLNIELN